MGRRLLPLSRERKGMGQRLLPLSRERKGMGQRLLPLSGGRKEVGRCFVYRSGGDRGSGGGLRRGIAVVGEEGGGVGDDRGEVVDAVSFHRLVEVHQGFDVAQGVGFLFLGHASLSALATVFDLVERVEQQAEFAGVADVASVQVGVGGLQAGDGVDQQVGGQRLDDLAALGLEVAHVVASRRGGAGHALADLTVRQALAAQVVGLESFGSLGGVHGWAFPRIGHVFFSMIWVVRRVGGASLSLCDICCCLRGARSAGGGFGERGSRLVTSGYD